MKKHAGIIIKPLEPLSTLDFLALKKNKDVHAKIFDVLENCSELGQDPQSICYHGVMAIIACWEVVRSKTAAEKIKKFAYLTQR